MNTKIISDYPLNENILEVLKTISEDYEMVATLRIKNDGERKNLVRSLNRKCIFCGKSSPEATFKNDSHLIPEFIGNKSLYSENECDSCNIDHFSRFENEMANFMLPFNTLARTHGKKKKNPKYKLKGQPIIEFKNGKFFISELPDSVLRISDNKNFDFPVKLPTYIPEYIYRCLVKIGLSIIPDEKLSVYKGTIKWLMDIDAESNIKPFMLFSIYPFSHQMNEIICSVLERKEECTKDVPYSILFLSYGSFAFQTCIPYASKEKLNVKLKIFPFIYPTPIDFNKNHEGLRSNNLIDLSSKEKVSNVSVTFNISGERELNS